jgi:hypothetical protein
MLVVAGRTAYGFSGQVVFFTSIIVAIILDSSLELLLFLTQPLIGNVLQQPSVLWLELKNSKPGRQEQLVSPFVVS